MQDKEVKIIECPRDAMQGLEKYISVEDKVNYINALLKVGYDTIDAGSFVSPKAIPQLRDTAEVLSKLHLTTDSSKLLVIVANKRGAEEAVKLDEVTYLGFPFSISPTFQKRNINSSLEESLKRLDQVKNLAAKKNKRLVTYFSMAFGNPYGDEWNEEIVTHWADRLLTEFEVDILSMSDTIGTSNPSSINAIFSHLFSSFSKEKIEIGAHLHTTPDSWEEKIESAWNVGCRRFDSAIKGYGGCPMAKDDLTGNMPTEKLIEFCDKNNFLHGLDRSAFNEAMRLSSEIFPH